ncbi:hypothetical protein ACFQXB_01120 [Plastorhodobacter daqingensis]|uniref:Uncharacterized protein n=1 Tax=Plastorhodobacter daqingensis TaxID=1387281 RepID=A0ABW2UDM9_9RHOB
MLRLIDYPIRDANWGTVPTSTVRQDLSADGARFSRRFHTQDGAIEGCFSAEIVPDDAGVRLVAELLLQVQRDCVVNRAGLVVLHPLDGVVGEGLTIRHASGELTETSFPRLISARQPVLDIVGLTHRVDDVVMSIAFEGEIFEMEDQRNWTDASFKTYCRPLALPRPYSLTRGQEVRQKITAILAGGARATTSPASSTCGRQARASVQEAAVMPDILLAHETAISGPPHPQVPTLAAQGILLRADATMLAVEQAPPGPVTLELVIGQDPVEDLHAAACALRQAGLTATRVIALPRGYLQSHQPSGPWPEGPTPAEIVPLVRQIFPDAEVGGGMLTFFPEFNRCPPRPALVDFTTFGTSAIVHAADDMSVSETLEAIPQVIESGRALSGGRPLRLGLMSIGMRSNPYGAAVIANPEGRRLPMAMEDPRQRTPFAAAFAVALGAACARGGVAAFAPAMTAGPLGMADQAGPWPIWHVVAALAALSGEMVLVEGGPATGLVTLRASDPTQSMRRGGLRGLAVNLGPGDVQLEGFAVRIPDRGDWTWIDAPGPAGPLTLPPMTAAILTGERA